MCRDNIKDGHQYYNRDKFTTKTNLQQQQFLAQKGYEETDFKLRHNFMMGYFSNRNVGIVKDHQTNGIDHVTIFHPIFSVLVKNNEKYCLLWC